MSGEKPQIFCSKPKSNFSSIKDGPYIIRKEGVDFELLLNNTDKKAYKRLFVLFSGARDPKKNPLPKFDRWKWCDRFPGVMLHVSDPAFYEKDEGIRIGWYTGPRDHDYSKTISSIVLEIASILDVENKNIIFYGSSAGGFASIATACHIKDSTSVAINPQVNVLKYNVGHVVNNFLKYVYRHEEGSLNNTDELRLDAAVRFKLTKHVKCLYVQNSLDIHHYEDHYKYFIDYNFDQCMNRKDDRIRQIVYSSKGGHGPEPNELVNEIVAKAIELSSCRCSF